MDWRDHIHSDPGILSGKPVVRGSRISVEFLLDLLAAGWSEKQLFDSYPNLTQDSLRAVFAFAAESTRDERTFELRRGGTHSGEAHRQENMSPLCLSTRRFEARQAVDASGVFECPVFGHLLGAFAFG